VTRRKVWGAWPPVSRPFEGQAQASVRPHLDVGDHVVVSMREDPPDRAQAPEQAIPLHTGYIGGLREVSAEKDAEDPPGTRDRMGRAGMLPKNRLGRAMRPETQGVSRARIRTSAAASRVGDQVMAVIDRFYGTGRSQDLGGARVGAPRAGRIVVNRRASRITSRANPAHDHAAAAADHEHARPVRRHRDRRGRGPPGRRRRPPRDCPRARSLDDKLRQALKKADC